MMTKHDAKAALDGMPEQGCDDMELGIWVDDNYYEIRHALERLAAEDAGTHKLVPVEATEDMMGIGEKIAYKAFSKGYQACEETIYQAMLSAAPTFGGDDETE